ncbi:MAG: malto-oligosyltrehalose trehalohydrolase [Anditalea sp.]
MKTIGARPLSNGGCIFTVWAPEKKRMTLHLVHPEEQESELKRDEMGYFKVEIKDFSPGARYFLKPDGENDYPDPASHFQPEGVHGPSEVINHAQYTWQDNNWKGIPFNELILYELHVGTFTNEGIFEAIIPLLDDIAETGINGIELMPVSQFPGNRNWGYDGVFPYAVQNTYGGPDGLKKLVDACHQRGIAVFMDVVYNHLGPEGNYFSNFGPYFTDQYSTPWGDAINFDGEWSDGVRDYFSNNALHWFDQYHMDGLRCDAIHAVCDSGAVNFWELTHMKIKALEQKLGRPLHMIAESDLNSPKIIKSPEVGGFGFTAQWLDDFHHALYVLLDKEGKDRYVDFGKLEQLAKAYTDGFVHSGEYVSFRKRKHGVSSAGVSGDKFVVYNQNHDQTGNRVRGERLDMLVDLERLKIAAAAIFLSPYVPMLFMGEEYADLSPFFYFVSHSDPDLIIAVQEGRKKEFESYNWDVDPPDPQDEETFNSSKLKWNLRSKGKHRIILQWHKKLIELRKSMPALANFNKNSVRVNVPSPGVLVLNRKSEEEEQQLLCLFNFSDDPVPFIFPLTAGSYKKLLDSTDAQWLEKAEETLIAHPEEAKAGENIKLKTCSVTVYVSSQDGQKALLGEKM